MFSLQQLAALDLYLWWGQEQQVAQALAVNQSTVSRHVRGVLQLLRLRLDRHGDPHPQLWGDTTLLQAERHVHQQARLRGLAPLRIEGTWSSGPWFLRRLPPGWQAGRSDLVGMDRPLQLLHERVIDAWVASYQPDLPDSRDPLWWVLDLVRLPVQLLAAPDHPLAGARRLGQGDFDPFPSLALPDGWFPRTEAILRRQGLWTEPVRVRRYDPSCWEGRCADAVTLAFGQSLSQGPSPATVRLDWDLGLISGEALVVRRDLAEAPAIQSLAEWLQRRARGLARRFDDVEAVA